MRLITKTICILLVLSSCNGMLQAQNHKATKSAVLFNNGPIVTHPGAGQGGADVSSCNSNQVINGTYCNASASAYVADDFTLASPANIESIDFYAFQENSGTSSTISGVYVQIWRGAPNAGGAVIWGDLTTNRLESVVFSNIYRTPPTGYSRTDRPIMKVKAGIGLKLNPGTYWVQVGFQGTLSSGPFSNPVTVPNELANGNSITFTGTIWKNNLDFASAQGTGAQFAVPFIVNGEVMTGCSTAKNLNFSVTGTQIALTWAAPDQAPTEYQIYQNGVKVATVPATTLTWTPGNLAANTYTFGVAAAYSSNCLPMQVNTNPIVIKTCPEANNVAVSFDAQSKATITWDAPTEEWPEMLWDNRDINISGYGLASAYWTTDNKYIYCADDFTANQAWTIQKITAQGFLGSASMKTTKFGITIFKDSLGKPGTELFNNRNITATDAPFGTIELTLPKAFTLQAGKYWIAIYGVFPISAPIQTVNARWLAFYGNRTTGSYNMMMKDPGNYMGKEKKEEWIDIDREMTQGALSMSFTIEGKPLDVPTMKYNVYLDGVKIADQLSDNSFYYNTSVDTTQKRRWCVTVACSEGGESDLSCEGGALGTSESAINPIAVFPNPASTQIFITSVQAKQIDIYDMEGKLVKCLKGNPVSKVDVSGYNSGVYVFRIFTSDKDYTTKSVVIVR